MSIQWDMGWMHDTLDLFQTGLEYRPANYHKLTFSMEYFGNEHYLLPLSHDEVVHGKATIAQKMAASDVEDKLAQARALYLYMFAHPGKKLNFMGWEVAQLREWDEQREQDWFLRRLPLHDAFFRFACELGAVYRNEDALWKLDYEDKGFEWVEASGDKDVVYAFLRRDGKEGIVLCALNLSDNDVERTYDVPSVESASVLLDTDWERFGGTTPDTAGDTLPCKGGVRLSLPACSGKLMRLHA